MLPLLWREACPDPVADVEATTVPEAWWIALPWKDPAVADTAEPVWFRREWPEPDRLSAEAIDPALCLDASPVPKVTPRLVAAPAW
jgi:hypothetical protein